MRRKVIAAQSRVKLTRRVANPKIARMLLRSAGIALLAFLAACDAGLEPEPICARGLVGVCGTLRFRGMIPPNTDNVFVAAYASFPRTCDDLITQRQPFIPGTVPYTDSIAAYSVPLNPGRYEWVLAVWKKVGSLTLTRADTALLRVAGFYRNASDTAQAGVVIVPSGAALGDINFVVDFDRLRPATDFVTCN
jgi:hypothetical protein